MVWRSDSLNLIDSLLIDELLEKHPKLVCFLNKSSEPLNFFDVLSKVLYLYFYRMDLLIQGLHLFAGQSLCTLIFLDELFKTLNFQSDTLNFVCKGC